MILEGYARLGVDIPYGRTTGKVKTTCPRCRGNRTHGKDKSFSANLDTGLFKCHYCQWAGSVLSLFPEEKRKWMEKQAWYRPPKEKKPLREYKMPKANPKVEISEKALSWFQSRGISQETLRACKITEGMEWMPQKEGQANTIQFNYYLDGKLVNVKYRTGDKCFKLSSGARLIPYLIDNIKGERECIITEGEMDALSFYECGRRDVISVPNGANANLGYLDDFLDDYLDDKETIFIAVDTDLKGLELRKELLRRFGAERCRLVSYDEGCKDANEQLMKYGKESLLACLFSAEEVKVDGVFTIDDFEDSLDILFQEGMQRGFTIGHEAFDSLCSFETKRLCIVTGIPGSGKSEFIDEIAERLNIRYGWRFAYFSPENQPLAYHASKLIEKFTGKRFQQGRLTQAEYLEVKQHLREDFFFISPQEDYRLTTILEKAKYLVRRKGIKALVIDPFNRLEEENEGISETKYISKLLDRLTNFAQQNDLLVILMAHPTKQPRNKEGIIEAPTLYDISGSAHFFNKTDFGIVVHRDRANNLVEIHVQKVKFRHLGEPGVAYFKYNINNGRYSPSSKGCDIEPRWDNSNHLIDKRHAEETAIKEGASLEISHYEIPRPEDLPF